jgi:thiol-disulfide isomerase/thioredoxin
MQSRRSLVPRLLAAAAVTGGLLPAVRGAAQSEHGPPALEFAGIDGWLNTAAPPTISGLRGKVVLVDFWTYSCINWRRTAAYLNRWQAEYGASGLQVVGVHTPEFAFERDRGNVEAAVREFGIRYPVGQDNGYRTWRAWDNRAWPSFYLLDRDGRIVLVREGEGHARELEGAIRDLLGLARSGAVGRPGDDADLSRIGTPEIYFGSLHSTPQDRAQSPRRGEAAYTLGKSAGPRLNQYQLNGTWAREEALVLRSPRGGLRVRFSAAKLHLVAAAPRAAPLLVSVDGGVPREIEVGRPTLYTLLDGERYGEHLLEFGAETPGLSLFSATFG